MCLSLVTKTQFNENKWRRGYKVVISTRKGDRRGKHYLSPFSSTPLYAALGTVISDPESKTLLGGNLEYRTGFHCFKRRKDAEAWRQSMCMPRSYPIVPVYVRKLTAVGKGYEGEPIFVGREIYYPTKKGDKPQCA